MRSAVLRRSGSDMGAINAQSPRNIGPPKRPCIWPELYFGFGVAFARVLERHHLHIYQLAGLQSLDAEDHDCPAPRPNVAMAEWSILKYNHFQRQSWVGVQEPISRPFRECARAALEHGRSAGNGNEIKANSYNCSE